MGMFSAVGASAGIVSPLMVSNVYKEMGPRWTYLVIDFILILTISLIYKKLTLNYQMQKLNQLLRLKFQDQ